MKEITILTASNRTKDGDGYSSGRSDRLAFERFSLTIPPQHKPSQVEYPTQPADADRAIVVTARTELTQQRFLREGAMPSGDGSVGIFVHGFNYTYQESLFRLAQIAADADVGGSPVLFSWPSAGQISGYLADRDAALYSRDDLAWLTMSLAKTSAAKRVILFGHSAGAFLIMETLRQLKLQGQQGVLDRLTVVLAAPDIDDDLFRSQIAVVGKMETPITIFVSKDDKALAVSSLLTGDRPRVGRLNVDSPAVKAAAARYGFRVVDISAVGGPDGLGHDGYVALAGIGPQIASLDGRKGTLPEAGAYVFDVAASVAAAPFRLAGTAVLGR